MRTLSRRAFLKMAGAAGGAAVLAACGGGGGATNSGSAGAPAAPKQEVTLEIESVGNELKWNKEKLEAPANSKITVKLKNNADAGSGMKHNWALIKPGQVEAVANAGVAAGEATGYIKKGDPNVIADTGLIEAGKTGSITFDAPAPGDYPYICTFPGHYVLMKGTLTIK